MSEQFIVAGRFEKAGQVSRALTPRDRGDGVATRVSVNLSYGWSGTISCTSSADGGKTFPTVESTLTAGGTFDISNPSLTKQYRLEMTTFTSAPTAPLPIWELFNNEILDIHGQPPGGPLVSAMARKGGGGSAGGSVTLSGGGLVSQTVTASGFAPGTTVTFYKNGSSQGAAAANTSGVATFTLALANGDKVIAAGLLASSPATATVTQVIPVAPNYLPTVGSAPYAAWGPQRLISGYSGPLLQVRRASDNATMDIYSQTGGDYPDYNAVQTWAGSSLVYVSIMYDQTGNSRNKVQATAANQPAWDLTQVDNNAVPVLYDSINHLTAGGTQPVLSKNMVATGLSLNASAMSVFYALKSEVSYNTSAIWSGTDSAFTNLFLDAYQATTTTGGFAFKSVKPSNLFSNAMSKLKASKSVLAFLTTATTVVKYIDGYTDTSTGTVATNTVQNLYDALTTEGGTAFYGKFAYYGSVVYNAALSTGDAASVIAAMQSSVNYPTAYDYRLVFDGDSIMEGTGATLIKNVPNQINYSRRAELYNTAVYGQTLNTINSAKSAIFAPLSTGGVAGQYYYVLNAGINDVNAGTTGATAYSYTASIVSYLHGLGFKCAICTLLPRGDVAQGGSIDTERLNYNTLVKANSAGADVVIDLAAQATMGTYANTNNTTYYVDQIHPTNLGYSLLAPVYQAGLAALMGQAA